MRTDLIISPARPAAVRHICRNMRAADLAEIFSVWPHSDVEKLASELIARLPYYMLAKTARLKGQKPVVFWAVEKTTPVCGLAHMFATDDFRRVARPLARHIRQVGVPAMLAAGLRRVEVRARQDMPQNTAWLKLLGARFECVVPEQGNAGEPFVQYAWRKSDVSFQ